MEVTILIIAALIFGCCAIPRFARRLLKLTALFAILVALISLVCYAAYSWDQISKRGRDEQHPVLLTRKDLVNFSVNKFWVYDDESGIRWTKRDGKWMFLYQGNWSNADDNAQYRGQSPEFKAACVFTKHYFVAHPDERPPKADTNGQWVLPDSARETRGAFHLAGSVVNASPGYGAYGISCQRHLSGPLGIKSYSISRRERT
jgi:hypothetical protein